MEPNVSKETQIMKKTAAAARRAYVTFLAGDGDYWKGVVGLAKGLRRVRSAYPLVVAVLPDVPDEHRRALLDQGCVVREIQPVYPPDSQTQFAMAYYVINYSKLRIWEFIEYDRMVYLDADIQAFDNIDHLFELDKGFFYAVKDCFCEKTLATAKDMLNTLVVTPPTPFAEQDFLNMFFQQKYRPIPPVYNLVLAMLWRHPDNVELDKVKVVHYCAAGSKPWKYTGKEANMDRDDIKMLVNKWWDIFNDESLDYKDADADEASQPLRTALAEAGAVKYYPAPSAA
ncbi:hypothetical protein ABZP36_000401 [Zizania latifolia]